MRRQIGIMSLVGAAAFLAGGLAAFASPVADNNNAPLPIESSVVTISATTPTAAEQAGMVGMDAVMAPAPFGYTYVVYFPVGTAELTQPASEMLAAVADEVTGLELSRVTLSSEDGSDARTQVVRSTLVEMGVPARWIGEKAKTPSPMGQLSMAAR